MSEGYRVVAGRIRRELNDVERVIERAERALRAAQQRPEDVVRSMYAFEFDRERLEPLVRRLQPTFESVREELLTFSDWLEQVARSSGSEDER